MNEPVADNIGAAGRECLRSKALELSNNNNNNMNLKNKINGLNFRSNISLNNQNAF